ncbi:basement membrane-specific heparan sulfate proteoglycan core protein-like [Synchiropus splendidus]|uniref:basement membrane-specific heparan sulfate proteoglycan core protein-like n=1 Tax=Synchiropus splendidus TaxID=270530 RepID=UPI00237E4222|nr:basement membrane-specific heparan sulfate proteoglycan core protein-like [Synchiropus splendidus]XP_053712884.1 basement membrane-specific heparan sulfate proteoglycan core protein-like [Synchiropus splendidus]
MELSRAALLLFCLICSASGQPVVTLEPRSITVRQGEAASFRCQVQGPASSVQLEWKRGNNQPLQDNVKISSNGSLLTVTNARPGNNAQYHCVATTPAGRKSVTAALHVRYPPKVSVAPSGPIRVRMGEQLSVQCQATGKPKPKLSWRRQGSTLQLVTEEVDGVNTIKWPVLRSEDSGVYICQATNTEGVSEVKVEITAQGAPGAPLASVSPTELTAVEGHTVVLRCQATGSPAPIITWSKLRAPLPWKHTVDGGVLTLTSVGRQDSGQYICNATNRHGYSEAYTQMEVESPPYTTILPEQVRLRPGDALQLQCLAHGSPPIRYEWSRQGGGGMPAGSDAKKDGKLNISQVRLGDGGTYKCVATNHIGSSEAVARVIVRA